MKFPSLLPFPSLHRKELPTPVHEDRVQNIEHFDRGGERGRRGAELALRHFVNGGNEGKKRETIESITETFPDELVSSVPQTYITLRITLV